MVCTYKNYFSFTAYCLGFVFLVGLHNIYDPVGLYLMILSFFHFSEYMTTGMSNPQNLSWDSFLVNHSVQYWVAMLVSWLEHSLLTWLLPSWRVNLAQVWVTNTNTPRPKKMVLCFKYY